MAYLNFDAIFEFLKQLTIGPIYYFTKNVDNFEIENKICSLGIGAVPLKTQEQSKCHNGPLHVTLLIPHIIFAFLKHIHNKTSIPSVTY